MRQWYFFVVILLSVSCSFFSQEVKTPPRLNHLIPKLMNGEVVFGSAVPVGSKSAAKRAVRSGWDFAWFEMEHSGFSLVGLEDSMQYLLDRRQILQAGTLAPAVVPLVRIPSNGSEFNQWIIKQALDQGVYGILFPHINTVEQARHAVQFSRYAQEIGAADISPPGHRGVAPGNAMRWWGITDFKEYHRRADVWPLDPSGELMVWILIEEEEGVRNLSEILRSVPVSAVIAAEVDLSTSMGVPGGRFSPAVEEVMDRIVTICQEHQVPVGALTTRENVERRVERGYQILITGDAVAIDLGRRAARERKQP